jgi:hypothetical protein
VLLEGPVRLKGLIHLDKAIAELFWDLQRILKHLIPWWVSFREIHLQEIRKGLITLNQRLSLHLNWARLGPVLNLLPVFDISLISFPLFL